jgi:ABC-type transporter Mla maintaining outer membrane lipid asymmetry ATPase subunit MlaF
MNMADKLLIQISDLHKAYGDKIIFDRANVSIVENLKVFK